MSPSPGFQVTFAARTEDLLDQLLHSLVEPASNDPTYRECIVVQNRGMARWLELQLATALGVWANPWFPFPEELTYRLWRALSPAAADDHVSGGFERADFAWSITAALPELLDEPAFAPLRAWVGEAREWGRVISLAGRIADVFAGYLVHRPDLVLAWDGADDEALPPDLPADLPAEEVAWQAPLWRAVVKRSGPHAVHPARRAVHILQALDGPATASGQLERLQRVSVFGLSALSPTYVQILAALGRHVPVCVYAPAPAPLDAVRVGEAVRALAKGAPTAPAAAEAGWEAAPPLWRPGTHVSQGISRSPAPDVAATWLDAVPAMHPLVQHQAVAGRAFQVLVALAEADVRLAGAPSPTGSQNPAASSPPTLLAQLQADVTAAQRPTERADLAGDVLRGRDRSIGLHSCHGPLREVEVLRDQLLDAFDTLSGLAPHDIVIMTPDVEAYAPYVEAVFGMGRAAGTAIPFRVADRAPQAGRPGVEAFLRALRALRGRMTAPEVLDLLALAPVRRARGLDEEALERLKAWTSDAGIRWGLDADHRASVGQPALAANTWAWGLTRLALGWSAPGDGRSRFHGVLPFGPAGADPALVGTLAELVDRLEIWRHELLNARLSVDEWAERLGQVLAELVGDDRAVEDDRSFVEGALGRLVNRATAAGFADPLGLDAVTDLVTGMLAEDPPARGFLEGAVTVCALQPMRAIPFRVVALVGMNDGAFPRTDRPPGFDLAARFPRLGDHVRRDADRLLFLEALQSARERLIITWTGQDPRTNVPSPPSAVVSDLVDLLRAMTGLDAGSAGAAGENDLIMHHRLHAYSPWYFGGAPRTAAASPSAARPASASPDRGPLTSTDTRWYSYGAAYAPPGSDSSPRRTLGSLAPERLPPLPPETTERAVDLDALARFLESPARRFARDRLGIYLSERGAPVADREPMTLDALDRHKVGDALLAALLEGIAPDEAVALAAAEGRLPLGTPGALAVQPLRASAEQLAALAAALRAAHPPRHTAVNLRPPVAGMEPGWSTPAGRAGTPTGGPSRPRSAAIDLRLPEIGGRLTGSLDSLWPAGRVEAGYGRLGIKRELRLWVRHLALNVAVQQRAIAGVADVSWAVGRPVDKGEVALLRLDPVPEARQVLCAIVQLWLDAECHVVPFFPWAARAYTQALATTGPDADQNAVADALHRAAKAFGAGRRESDDGGYGFQKCDLDDPYLALLLGDALPWDDDGEPADADMIADFQRLAKDIFSPLDSAATRVADDNAQVAVENGAGRRVP